MMEFIPLTQIFPPKIPTSILFAGQKGNNCASKFQIQRHPTEKTGARD